MSDAWLYRTLMGVNSPKTVVVLKNVQEEDPRKLLDDLREADPDGHALLTEHIVLEDSR